MIQLRWGQIREPQFIETYERLLRTKMPVSVAKKISVVTENLQREYRDLTPRWAELQGKYLEPAPGTENKVFQLRWDLGSEDKKHALEELHEFGQTLVEINIEPIRLEEIPDFQITPVELGRLKGLICVEGS